MKYATLFLLLLGFTATSCNNGDTGQAGMTDQEAFFNNIADLCGQEFRGAGTYPLDEPDHDLIDIHLTLVVDTCDEDTLQLPLYTGERDHPHATWELTLNDEGELHLRHDHRDEDGEPYDPTDYGGWADDRGDATTQYFPADERTADMLPEAETNVWKIDLDLEKGTVVYYLTRHDEPRFRAGMHLAGDPEQLGIE